MANDAGWAGLMARGSFPAADAEPSLFAVGAPSPVAAGELLFAVADAEPSFVAAGAPSPFAAGELPPVATGVPPFAEAAAACSGN